MADPDSPSPMDEYLFDLRGYLVLPAALTPMEVDALNAGIDAIGVLEEGQWRGCVQGHSYRAGGADGRNLQNIVEGGAPFEALIDHPSWMSHVRRFVGKEDGLFIDECFATLRGPSQYIHIHSGGHRRRIRTQYRFHNHEFRCGQVNVLIALSPIREMGDGPTVVIPGSHKANLPHPAIAGGYRDDLPPERVEGAVPVFLEPGDALLFVDALCHGGSSRTRPGLRRNLVYRYGPNWGSTRLGYIYSDELIARLTPERAKILRPVAFRRPPAP